MRHTSNVENRSLMLTWVTFIFPYPAILVFFFSSCCQKKPPSQKNVYCSYATFSPFEQVLFLFIPFQLYILISSAVWSKRTLCSDQYLVLSLLAYVLASNVFLLFSCTNTQAQCKYCDRVAASYFLFSLL